MNDLISYIPDVKDIICTCHEDTLADAEGLLPAVFDLARKEFHRSELSGVIIHERLATVPKLTPLRFGIRSRGIHSAHLYPFDIIHLLPFLTNISTLELSMADLNVWDPDTMLDEYFLSPFRLNAKNAESLETPYLRVLENPAVSHQEVHFESPRLDAKYPPLPGLRHLRVYGSTVREFAISLLVQRCLNLETLLIKFEADFLPYGMKTPPTEDCRINPALLARSSTLTSLTMLGSGSGNVLHA